MKMDTYVIGNVVVEEDRRDRFRALAAPETYDNLKTREPEVGELGSYKVDLTEKELDNMLRDRPSNLRYVEPVPPKHLPCVDGIVPSGEDMAGSKVDKLPQWGFTGRGIVVGVIDTGLGAAVSSKFHIKAIRGEEGTNPYVGSHGSYTASVALPRHSRLVFSRGIDEKGVNSAIDGASWVKALYWMADEQGVHVVNMSFGSLRSSYQHEIDAINNAKAKNVLLVAAAGNDGVTALHYPAAYSGVISVGALNPELGWSRAQRSDWASNYGSWVDMWAAGVGVKTYDQHGNIVYKEGTSLAAPLVAYTKAALLTKGLHSIGQIKTERALVNNADRRTAPGDAPQFNSAALGGGGKLDGHAAVFKLPEECEQPETDYEVKPSAIGVSLL